MVFIIITLNIKIFLFFENFCLKYIIKFVSETSNIILDLDIVLNKLVDATKKLKPPSK